MKRIFQISVLAFLVMLGSAWGNRTMAQSAPDDEVSYQTFYDDLSPYGRWLDNPDYGYVWVPNVDQDFRPYGTNGHWVYTDDYEWMWVSDYDWGWAPFHYGRWYHDNFYGWVWVPGYEWSPAWVAWRDGGDYYGWAPLQPGFGVSINISLGGYNPPYDYWCFTPRRYITDYHVYNYCMPRRNNITIINQTTIINNYRYSNNVFRSGGPRRGDVERYAGRVTPVRFRSSNAPGRSVFDRHEVRMYRPNVSRNEDRGRVAPRQVGVFERRDGGRGDNAFRGNRDGRSRGANDQGRVNNDPNRGGNIFGDRQNGRLDNPGRMDGNRGNNNPNRGGSIFGDRQNGRSDNPGRTDNGNRGNNDRGGSGNDRPSRGSIFDRSSGRPDATTNNPGNDNRGNNGRGFGSRDNTGTAPGNTDGRVFRGRDQSGTNSPSVDRGDNRANRPVFTPRNDQQRMPDARPSNPGQNTNRVFTPRSQPSSQPRMEQPRSQQPRTEQQPRVFERRDNGGSRQSGNSNGGGHGRFGRG